MHIKRGKIVPLKIKLIITFTVIKVVTTFLMLGISYFFFMM